MARQRKASEAPFQVGLRRLGFRALGRVSPKLGGKLAADLFLRAREGRTPTPDVTPLGARRVRIRAVIGHVYEWGPPRAPAVMLVHGWGADSSSMYSLVRPLVARGFRVLAYDAPAHGTSPGNATTMTAVVAAVHEVCSAVGDVTAIVGHSLGALATIAAVTRWRRAELRHVVLLSAPCSLDGALLSFADFWRLAPPIVAEVRAELHVRNGVPIGHWDMRTLAVDFEVPVLAIHDVEDVFIPFCELEKVRGALHASQTHVTQGLGHARILADTEVAGRIAAFLGDAPAHRASVEHSQRRTG